MGIWLGPALPCLLRNALSAVLVIPALCITLRKNLITRCLLKRNAENIQGVRKGKNIRNLNSNHFKPSAGTKVPALLKKLQDTP
jgi:hypothetical protein